MLGSHLKYSCGHWKSYADSLDKSEEAMLKLTCERAGICDGMKILDLGCGWGSLTLWIAQNYPNCQITSLSNSASQREFIQGQCVERGFDNVEVLTADVGKFDTDKRFDRVVSVEMFEHVRNHEDLLRRISQWLLPSGELFVHIFCHENLAYTFETEGAQNWMGRHFFSGGIMPARDLFLRYQDDLCVTQQWWISGTHYAKTCEAWLDRLDRNKSQAMAILADSENNDPPGVQVQRWRMFFMACAELFSFDSGKQWGVGHYLFSASELKDRVSP